MYVRTYVHMYVLFCDTNRYIMRMYLDVRMWIQLHGHTYVHTYACCMQYVLGIEYISTVHML